MGKKAKGDRIQVILECTEHKESGMESTIRKSKKLKKMPQRLRIKY